MDPVFSSALRTAFSSQYAFLIKAQDAHWNVQGDDFYEAHLLFERIYEEVQGAIDTFAEFLRATQVFVPSGLNRMRELSIVQDFTVDNPDLPTMYQALLDDSDRLAELFSSAYDLAEQNKECGLSNFFADRQAAHRKHSWMLRMNLIPDPTEAGDN